MKKIWLLLAIIPAISFSQTKKEIKAKAAADKIITTNIQAHIKFLADDKLEGRRAGSPGETLAMQYIANHFKKYALAQLGTNGYFQQFEINEGKHFVSNQNYFKVNGINLEPVKEYYPLSFSANAGTQGLASLVLKEKGEPWYWDLKDLLEENKQNPHLDIYQKIKTEADRVADEQGKALILYNSSSTPDNIHFLRFDTTVPATIPVVYITKHALLNHFKDITDIYEIDLNVALVKNISTAHNVIGYIDNNAPTTVVLGAHFDHLGFGYDGNNLSDKGSIYNGADDNASGTAALLELARIVSKINAKNNNYLFIAFSGEELGLLGSKYWLQNNTMNTPINYMINMDMVGRYDPDKKLTVGGYGTSPEWSKIFSTVHLDPLQVRFDSSGSGPSDHATFYRKNIPVLFFFTNTHSDYHKISDDWNKINFTGETAIINSIVQVIQKTDDKGKLTFTPTSDMEIKAVSLPVTLGIMPDYAFTGKGVRIENISKNKNAERIGLLAGDVLLQIGEYSFAGIPDYMNALQHFNKGDTTVVYFYRGSEKLFLDFEFK